MRSAKKSTRMDSHEATRLYMNGQMDVDTYTDIVCENVRRPAEATETLWAKQARQEWWAGFLIGVTVGGGVVILMLVLIAVL